MTKRSSGKPQLLSLEQVQERFREEGIEIHKDTIKKYLRLGYLKGRKQGKGETAPWVVFADSVEEYLSSLPHSP